MRHLGSVVLALLIAPLVLLLGGRGLTEFTQAAEASRSDPLATAVAFAALGLAGMLYAALTLPRLSPLGPAFAGVGYLAVSSLLLLGPADLLDRLGDVGVALDEAQVTTAAALAALLALPMLLTIFDTRRWRSAPPTASSPLPDTQEMPTISLY